LVVEYRWTSGDNFSHNQNNRRNKFMETITAVFALLGIPLSATWIFIIAPRLHRRTRNQRRRRYQQRYRAEKKYRADTQRDARRVTAAKREFAATINGDIKKIRASRQVATAQLRQLTLDETIAAPPPTLEPRKLMLEEVNALITAASKSARRDELLDDIAKLQEAKKQIAETTVKEELDALVKAICDAKTVADLLGVETKVESFYGETEWYFRIPVIGRIMRFWIYE